MKIIQMYYSDTKGGRQVILLFYLVLILINEKYWSPIHIKKNPVSGTNYYSVKTGRLFNSILLGIMTYDANLLIIKPKIKCERLLL